MQPSLNARFLALVTWITAASFSCALAPAWAQPPTAKIQEKEEASIPKKPSAPPTLSRQPPPDVFSCQRRYMYKGRILPCDSNLHKDAEGLRPIFKDLPQATAELDQYQLTQQNIQKMAYVGSIGAFAAGIALLVVKPSFLDNSTAVFWSNVIGYAGLATAGGSFIYSLSVLRNNEQHLNNAIQIHNTAYPDTPIELQVRAGFTF